MYPNPAYNAIKGLQKKLSNTIKFTENKKGDSYCMIHLLPNPIALTMGGKIYQPESNPHISIYQFYNKNENHGLSVFHYTWYGFIEESNGSTPVVLHVYFDRVGRYRCCQLKNRVSNEIIQIISPLEENVIKQHANLDSQKIVGHLLAHIATKYAEADQLVDKYLLELDDISQHITTQLAKYKKIAGLCIDSMQKKNKWSFDKIDPRESLLKQVVIQMEDQLKNQSTSDTNKLGFYSSQKRTIKDKKLEIQTIQDEKKQQTKNKKITTQLTDPTLLLQALAHIDNEINETKLRSEISPAEKSLLTLTLLNKKFNALIKDNTSLFLDNELIGVMQEINYLHTAMKPLFEKAAHKGDIDSLKLLQPYISQIDIYVFAELIRKGNITVCEYIIQNFDECLFYFNNAALSFSSLKEKMVEESFTLLQLLFCCHKDTKFLEMCLKNGADPNFYGATSQNHKGILYLSITTQRTEFVRVLLENGANVNPSNCSINNQQKIFSPKDLSSISNLGKAIRSVNKNESHLYDNNSTPLFEAIATGNKTIIALLLQYGASVTQKDDSQFDAIGQATCHNKKSPDLDIVKLLIDHKANINALQNSGHNQTSALMFACQRGDLDSVKGLITLGADPNQLIPNTVAKLTKNNQPIFQIMHLTPLSKAMNKNHREIVLFLISQREKPITFITAAMAFALKIRIHSFNIVPNTLDIQLPGHLKQTELLLFSHFDRDTIKVAINELTQRSGQYYKEGKYEDACNLFHVPLILGDKNNRLSSLYNLACSYKCCDDKEKAAELFQVCLSHAPNSVIGRNSAKELEKLLQASQQITMRMK